MKTNPIPSLWGEHIIVSRLVHDGTRYVFGDRCTVPGCEAEVAKVIEAGAYCENHTVEDALNALFPNRGHLT